MNPTRIHPRTIIALPVLATLSLVGSTLILPSGVLASDAGDASSHKVFVCKYVGTPGEDERLMAGKNPISVDLHTIDEYKDFQGDIDALVGARFADAHGRSFVLAVDRGQPEPPVSACPGYVPSATPTATPTATPDETPTATPDETPTATPDETLTTPPTASPTATPSDMLDGTDPTATPTPDPVSTPTNPTGGGVDVEGAAPQITPPATDATSAMQADHDGNVVPVLLLLAGLTGAIAVVTPSARTRTRRNR